MITERQKTKPQNCRKDDKMALLKLRCTRRGTGTGGIFPTTGAVRRVKCTRKVAGAAQLLVELPEALHEYVAFGMVLFQS